MWSPRSLARFLHDSFEALAPPPRERTFWDELSESEQALKEALVDQALGAMCGECAAVMDDRRVADLAERIVTRVGELERRRDAGWRPRTSDE